MKFLKFLVAFAVASVSTYVLTSVIGTQFVLADVSSFGLTVTMSDRIGATVHDLFGVLQILSGVVVATLLVAFTVAGLAIRYIGGERSAWYMAAGFLSLPLTMLSLRVLLEVTPYAMAGTRAGLIVIGLCGLAGGYLFSRLTAQRAS